MQSAMIVSSSLIGTGRRHSLFVAYCVMLGAPRVQMAIQEVLQGEFVPSRTRVPAKKRVGSFSFEERR